MPTLRHFNRPRSRRSLLPWEQVGAPHEVTRYRCDGGGLKMAASGASVRGVMPKPRRMNLLRLVGLLPLCAVAACTQPSSLTSFAEKTPAAPAERLNPGTAPPDKWSPAPDVSDDEDLPNTERISLLPGKVGECADTTITSITDRYGEDLSPRAKKGADPGTIVRFSNSGVQVSLRRENSIVHSQIFDKVNMCLVEIPKECPKDIRGRIYKTTNLRTKESWNLANDIKNCGGA
jgi:hypothetical protein